MRQFSRIPRYVLLHCSDTTDGLATDAATIRRYHIEVLHWEDIGYHWVIERVNGVVTIVPGRSPVFEGAHCTASGRNRDSLGVCVVGKFDETPPDGALWSASVRLVATLAAAYGIPVDNCCGHREFEPRKSCPGTAWDLDAWRAQVRQYRGLQMLLLGEIGELQQEVTQ